MSPSSSLRGESPSSSLRGKAASPDAHPQIPISSGRGLAEKESSEVPFFLECPGSFSGLLMGTLVPATDL